MKRARGTYETFVRPLLFSLDPETAHRLTIELLRAASHFDFALHRLRFLQPPSKPKTLFGLNFPNPIGVAAGLDKNGVALPAWAALGFGFVEIGTVTAKAQPGNPKPRIFRLLRDFADYITLNVSSPNTPGLRELHEPRKLFELLHAIGNEPDAATKPVLVKISPDLSSVELEAGLGVCAENGVAGIIATNTTLDHSSVPPALNEEGGLSGAPLREKATALVRDIVAKCTIPVIASGGICDAESAREKFEAGAQLIQLYTGFVYRGPALLREIIEA